MMLASATSGEWLDDCRAAGGQPVARDGGSSGLTRRAAVIGLGTAAIEARVGSASRPAFWGGCR
jgi:hypothetical protein